MTSHVLSRMWSQAQQVDSYQRSLTQCVLWLNVSTQDKIQEAQTMEDSCQPCAQQSELKDDNSDIIVKRIWL